MLSEGISTSNTLRFYAHSSIGLIFMKINLISRLSPPAFTGQRQGQGERRPDGVHLGAVAPALPLHDDHSDALLDHGQRRLLHPLHERGPGLGFNAVVIELLFDFETCPNYQNCLKCTNKSTTKSQILRS